MNFVQSYPLSADFFWSVTELFLYKPYLDGEKVNCFETLSHDVRFRRYKMSLTLAFVFILCHNIGSEFEKLIFATIYKRFIKFKENRSCTGH